LAGLKRIGVFGGAFDPPHVAHHTLARAAIDQFKLETLHIVPTGSAWHKTRTLSAAHHRVAMAQLAFADLAQAFIDTREIERSGVSYTLDTLQELRKEQPQAQLYLFIGQDQAQSFECWHRWQDILEIAQLVVAQRPSESPDAGQWQNGGLLNVQRLAMPALQVSATHVRQCIAQGQSTDAYLLPQVRRYIDQHRLY
jgi:nicotinate-nucleotide adenylyltransferase